MEMRYLIGWKDMVKVSGIGLRTLKRWHYERKPIPYGKSACSKSGRVMISLFDFLDWLDSMRH